jgi:hypothetical protein
MQDLLYRPVLDWFTRQYYALFLRDVQTHGKATGGSTHTHMYTHTYTHAQPLAAYMLHANKPGKAPLPQTPSNL